MPISLAQSTSIGYTSADSTTTGSLTTTASGSTFIIAAHWQGGSTPPTISDSKSNTYTLIGSVRQVDNNGSFLSHIGLWYAQNGTGGSSHTFTAAKTGGYTSVYAGEITGGLTSGILDQNTGAALDASSPVTSGSITTTQAAELLIGFVGTFHAGSGPAYTANNSFSIAQQITDATNYWTGCLVSRVVSSTGTYETDVSVTNLTQGAALIASFKEDSGGASAISPAAGVSTTSTLTGRSTARATPSAAAGVSTTGTLAGSDASAVVSVPWGHFYPELVPQAWFDPEIILIGWFNERFIDPPGGASTISPAAGTSTTATLTGRSTARATASAAAGASTTGTLVGSDASAGPSTISPAAGVSTTGTLTGRAIHRAFTAPKPTIGVHTLLGIEDGSGTDPETTSPINTQPSGSSLVTFTAGYSNNTGGPTDSEGNTWTAAGSEVYTGYSGQFDVRGYYVEVATGDTGHTVTFQADGTPAGEMTIPFVEVKNAGKLVAYAKNYPAAGSALTSGDVTTTGPAVLVAFWWGDATGLTHTATPNNGFTNIESFGSLPPNSAVQCFVAAREVEAPGTYNVTWTETPDQGAPLWLFAFQNATAGAFGTSTTSTLTGRALKRATPSSAAGASTAATLTGRATAASTPTAAAGASSTSTLTGRSTAASTPATAAGAATAGTLTGRSTARATISPAAGTSTTGTLVPIGGASTISPAAGVSTTATLTGRSTAQATPAAAAGASTAATLAGSSTARATPSAAAGASSTATLTGGATFRGTPAAAAGASTAATLTGAATARATPSQANGQASAGTLAGSATARATPAPAAGQSTTGTLVGDGLVAGRADVVPAAGSSTTATLVGRATARATIAPAAGQSTTGTLAQRVAAEAPARHGGATKGHTLLRAQAAAHQLLLREDAEILSALTELLPILLDEAA